MQEFFDSLPPTERSKIQFWPKAGQYDAVESRALESLQFQWQSLCRGEWRAPNLARSDDTDRALQAFLGKRPLT
jgi:hypothetical protein